MVSWPIKRFTRFAFWPQLSDQLNVLVDAINSLRPVQSHGTMTAHTSRGVMRTAKPGSEAEPAELPVERFQIYSLAGAVLECKKFINDTDFEPDPSGLGYRLYQVALPNDLRNGFPNSADYVDGTFTLVDTDGITTEMQLVYTPAGQSRNTKVGYPHGGELKWTETIRPQYQAGKEILAIKLSHTGIPGVEWLDLNVAARHWDRDPILTQVCVDGWNKLALIVRSTHVDPPS